ncbi:hypothetical protein [Paenibacillus piscarius]|uniref:hypothetical protein n=1 Tax=Paenibacillus piscarius TaxID=1089681 RepID=UPI001EE7EB2E|nr:hypothetical protein [Paenibacillus piscarius]
MKLLSRVLFLISLITLGIYSFDLVVNYNRAFLFVFIIGFVITFVSTFFVKNDKINKAIRWISAAIVIIIFAYFLIFGFFWSNTKRP